MSNQVLIYGVNAQGQKVPLLLNSDGTLAGGSPGGGSTSTALVRTVVQANVIASGTRSAPFADNGRAPSFTADLTGTGTLAATVQCAARDAVGGSWILIGTIQLNGTTSVSDGFGMNARYMEYSMLCTAISGTGATLNLTAGS